MTQEAVTTTRADTAGPTRAADASRAPHAEAEPVVGLPVDRAAAMLPADLVQGDETIILLLKPHPLFIILAPLGQLVTITVVAWLISYLGWLTSYRATLLGAGLIALRLTWQFLEWLSRVYVLTDRRVIRVMGVLRVFVFEAPLRQIQHTDTIFTIRERVFRLGTVAFSTAGTGVPEAYWVMLARPLSVHRRIVQAINRYRN